MDNINILRKQAINGKRASADKLIAYYGTDISFICKALSDNSETSLDAEKAAGERIIQSLPQVEGILDLRLFVRQLTAEICINSSGKSLPPSDENNTDDTLPEDTINLPNAVLSDRDTLSKAEELMYYSTDSYEYRIFVMYYFCRMVPMKIAGVYGCSAAQVTSILKSARSKICGSLSSLSFGSSNMISLYALMDSIAGNKQKKKNKSSSGFFSSNKGKIIAISVFSILLIGVVCEIFLLAFGSVNNNNEQSEFEYIPYEETSNGNYQNNDTGPGVGNNNVLYTFLTCNKQESVSESGFSPEGFAVQSDNLTLLEAIVIDSSAEMINPDQLGVSFLDSKENYHEGKRFYNQNVFQIDERTFLIRIYAMGNYQPEQFKIDLYMYGSLNSSYILPNDVTPIDSIAGLKISNLNSDDSAQPGSIIALTDSDNSEKLCFFYVADCNVYYNEYSNFTTKSLASVSLIQIGQNYMEMDKTKFSYEFNKTAFDDNSDRINDLRVEYIAGSDDESMPFTVNIDLELIISFKNDDGPDPEDITAEMLKGSIVYQNNNQKINIEPTRF